MLKIQYYEYRTVLLLGIENRNAVVKSRSTKFFVFTYLDGTYMGLNAVSSINQINSSHMCKDETEH
jgi:hypothetical protein